jgi:hypothetical protein
MRGPRHAHRLVSDSSPETRKTLADLLAAIQGANVATKPIEL